MSFPKISVILPVFNCEKYVAFAIKSILDQSESDFELIIINDASRDGSEAVISRFADHRIRYLCNETNLGLIGTLNRGMRESKGCYIARMDSDDFSLKDRLKRQASFLDSNPKIDIVCNDIILIDENHRPWRKPPKNPTGDFELRFLLPFRNCFYHPCVMFRRPENISEILYDPGAIHAEDYELWLRMANSQKRFAFIDEPALLYRVHGESITSVYKVGKNESAIRALRKQLQSYPSFGDAGADELIWWKSDNIAKALDVKMICEYRKIVSRIGNPSLQLIAFLEGMRWLVTFWPKMSLIRKIQSVLSLVASLNWKSRPKGILRLIRDGSRKYGFVLSRRLPKFPQAF